jgi:hypothetical protein
MRRENMNNLYRTKLLQKQNRSYITGKLEMVDDLWLFIDDEFDEETDLEFYSGQEVEVNRNGEWHRGILQANGKVFTKYLTLSLEEQESIRIKKNLIFALEMLMDELNDDAFIQFISSLNSIDFSIYDCIFCHNHLSFLENRKIRQGVNFMTFDNGESVCAVQHHFTYYTKQRDRFEFTLSNGKRIMIEKFE